MIVDFSQINYDEPMPLILKNASEQTLGVLGYAKNRELDLKYNPVSTLSFELPMRADGIDVPFYDDVVGMRIVEVPGIGQFIINNPEETGDGVHRQKSVEAYSLEYEFTRKKITLGEGTYKFYDDDVDNSLIGMIMELMPAWSIGELASSIKNKYRTFSVENQNLYDFMMNTVQETYGCVFEFDTINRTVSVRDINDEPSQRAVWLSDKNLAKELTITENTDNICTRLDVNGADGVNIRDVNPDGTNKIVNLDYFMTAEDIGSTDLGQTIISKYNSWKELFNSNKESYYNLSVRYSLKLMQKVTEEANLTDLKNDVVNLDNQRAVTIQAISQGLQTQQALDDINAQMVTAQGAVDSKQSEIDSIDSELNSIKTDLTSIRDACNFRNYFTDDEWLVIDRYIKDDDVTENTFVAESSGAYMDEGSGSEIENQNITFNSGEVAVVTDAVGRDIVRLRGGILEIQDVLEANVVTGTIEYYNNNVICSMWLNEGTLNEEYFPSGCLTMTGTASGFGTVPNDEGMSNGICTMIVTGYMYFTYDVSEYQKHSVAWDLFEYGEATLNSLAYPSYTFSVSSANFVALPEYIVFRNALRLGERIYLEKSDGVIVRPILTGAILNLDDPMALELEFGDKYSSNDPAQKLVELLGQTVSMGKSVEAGKYIYSAFKDSGAETDIKRRMTSALDVAKNQIINSAGQAAAWDASGLHLREWTNSTETAYKDEQIWMNNTMIAMTDDGWETAKMAIGKFHDANAGDCWGIVAPTIMGTLIAGESLIIESQKKSGDTAVFRMDGDGCRLYNSDFVVSRIINNKTTKIALNPDFGIAIGDGNLYSVNAETGVKTLDTAHAKFYADNDGNLHLTGAIHASELYINDNGDYKDIDTYGSAKFTVNEEQISAVVGSTYAYLKSSGIEMSTSNSIVLKSGTTAVVQIDSSGITLAGNAINISNGSTSIALNASGFSIKSGSGSGATSLVTINNNGIDMTSGKFSVFATSNDSVIRFGGTVDNPNFSLGLGGDIIANNAVFGSISVSNGNVVMSPPGFTAPSIVVSKAQPAGSNIVWVEPNEVSAIEYSATVSGHALTSASKTAIFAKTGTLSLGGSDMSCGVRLRVYVYNGGVSNLTIRVDIRPYNSGLAFQTILNNNFGSVGDGGSLWADTTQSMSNMITLTGVNWTNYDQIEAVISCTRSGSGTVQLSSGTLTLKCMNASTEAVQTCTVHYIK